MRYIPLTAASVNTVPSLEEVWAFHAPYPNAPMLPEMPKRYEHVLGLLDSFLDADVYRALRLDPDKDPVRLDPLGIYWSYAKSTAVPCDVPIDLECAPIVRYRGRASADNVDVPGTVFALTHPRWGAEEQEVLLLPDTAIFVLDVELEDGTVVEINDWRRT